MTDIKCEVLVVVPTKNSSRTLMKCLQSIKNQSIECKLIVVDNFSTDGTQEIAKKYADVFIESGPERSAQRNLGAQMSTENIVGFIDSDMYLEKDVLFDVVELTEKDYVSVVIPEKTIGVGYWAKVSAYERSFYNSDDSIEAPRFFIRKVFEESGGWDEDMTGAEDWDLANRSLNFGARGRTKSQIIHDEGKVRFFEICKKKSYYAKGLKLYLSKYPGVSKLILTRGWLRPKNLFTLYGLSVLALKIAQALSMLFGLLWNKSRDQN